MSQKQRPCDSPPVTPQRCGQIEHIIFAVCWQDGQDRNHGVPSHLQSEYNQEKVL